MLAVSTDKLKKSAPAYSVACTMWQDLVPQILPTLLQLLRQVVFGTGFTRTANHFNSAMPMPSIIPPIGL